MYVYTCIIYVILTLNGRNKYTSLFLSRDLARNALPAH